MDKVKILETIKDLMLTSIKKPKELDEDKEFVAKWYAKLDRLSTEMGNLSVDEVAELDKAYQEWIQRDQVLTQEKPKEI